MEYTKYIFTLPKPKTMLHIGLLLMIFKVFIPLSDLLPQSAVLDSVLSFASAGILAFDIIQKNLSKKRLIMYGAVTLLALHTVVITGQYGFLITIVAIMAIANYDFDNIINFIYRWELFLFVVHTGFALLFSFSTEISIIQTISGEQRFNFGFGHPNTFSAYLFNLIIMWVWINYNKIKNKNIIAIFFIEFLSYLFTKTRTSMIDVMVFCLVILAAKYLKQNKILSNIAKFIVPSFSIIIFVLITQFITGNPVILFIDEMLSSRLRLGSYAYYHYGLTFFGQNIPFNQITWDPFWQLNGFTFDCTYTSLMMMHGIVWLIALLLGFYLLGKMRNNRISIVIIAWALYAITEVHGLNGFLCFPVLLFSLVLTREKLKFNKKLIKKQKAH